MTPDELRTARLALGMSQPALATVLGISVPMLSRFEGGLYPVPKWLPLALVTIKRRHRPMR